MGMRSGDGNGEGETPSPRTTIVGGRPPEDDRGLPRVPTGIQRLLRYAAIDEAFRDELVQRRAEMAPVAGVELTRSEEAILAAVPERQLIDMIAAMPPPQAARREFLVQGAASAVLLLGGAAFVGSLTEGCTPSSGVGEDDPQRPDNREMETTGGAAPHMPEEPQPERPDINEMHTEGGAAPHMPEELEEPPPPRPDVREMESDGGAAPDMPPERPVNMRQSRGIRPDIPRRRRESDLDPFGGEDE